jgi:thiol-disulfide isomerase/thioredoxin
MNARVLLCLVALVATSFAATAARPPLLAAGTVAPDFTAYNAQGKPVKLSDFKGQVVLVDFWSTWCGPCKASMPYMEKLHQTLGPKGLVVLGVCVWDTRSKFDGWIKSPGVKTSYLKVFDKAERDPSNIAKKLYSVSGIPAFYIVDAQGKIAYAGGGWGGARSEENLAKALAAQGLKM